MGERLLASTKKDISSSKEQQKKKDVGRVPIICKNVLLDRITFSTGENYLRSIKSCRTYVSNLTCKKYIVKNF